MRFPYGITVTVQRSTEDRFGDRTYADHHTVAGCAFAPGQFVEDNDRRDTVVATPTLYAPPSSDILSTDRLVLPGGVEFQVDGEPAVWSSPFTGWTPGVEIRLRRAD